MRILLFLSIISLLIASCNQSRTHLNKAEALLGIHYDSMLYHLIRIDYTSLTPSEQNNYHYLRMGTDISYLMSFTSQELDSLMAILKKARECPSGYAFLSIAIRESNSCEVKDIRYEMSVPIRR